MISVVACGPTGSLWDGSGPSIGVNDAEKFGRPVGALIVVNSDFELPRLQIIKKTLAPAGFYSQLNYWSSQPNFRYLPPMKRFNGRENLCDDFKYVYSSRTSPFVAISLAALWGHKEIVLYGVDFENHPVVNGDRLSREVDAYKRLCTRLEKRGIIVSLSTYYGALAKFLPIK